MDDGLMRWISLMDWQVMVDWYWMLINRCPNSVSYFVRSGLINWCLMVNFGSRMVMVLNDGHFIVRSSGIVSGFFVVDIVVRINNRMALVVVVMSLVLMLLLVVRFVVMLMMVC